MNIDQTKHFLSDLKRKYALFAQWLTPILDISVPTEHTGYVQSLTSF